MRKPNVAWGDSGEGPVPHGNTRRRRHCRMSDVDRWRRQRLSCLVVYPLLILLLLPRLDIIDNHLVYISYPMCLCPIYCFSLSRHLIFLREFKKHYDIIIICCYYRMRIIMSPIIDRLGKFTRVVRLIATSNT